MPKPDRFVQSFLCNTGLWQTDGQTDRHTQGRSYSASLAVAAPEGRSRVGFSLCEAAERRRHEERGAEGSRRRSAEGSRRRRRRDERRRREGRGYPPPHPTKRSVGSVVSSPSGVWGGAPAEIDLGAFCH